MKYFLDTNVLYHVSKFSVNNKINSFKLEKLISNDLCYTSIYSVFELMNNSHNGYEGFIKIYRDAIGFFRTIGFYTNNLVDKYIDMSVWNSIDIQPEKVVNSEKKKFIFYLSKRYSEDIALETMIIFTNYVELIIYVFKHSVHPRTQDISNYLGNLIDSLRLRLNRFLFNQLTSIVEKGNFNEKNIKYIHRKIILNLISEYIPIYNWSAIRLNNDEYPNYVETKQKLKEWYLSIDFDKYSLEPIKEEYVDLQNIFKAGYKLDKEHINLLKPKPVKELIMEHTMSNFKIDMNYFDYEYEFSINNIKMLLEGNFSIKANNYIDKYIVEQFMHSDADIFITFDENLLKVLRNSKEKKLKESIKIIKTLYDKKITILG